MQKLKLLKYWIFLVALQVSTLLFSSSALAQVQLPADLKPDYVPDVPGLTAEDKIYGISGNIIVTISQLVGGIAVILIIYNGFKYTISRGEEDVIGETKGNLGYIAAGLVLIAISYVVIRFVVKATLFVDEIN